MITAEQALFIRAAVWRIQDTTAVAARMDDYPQFLKLAIRRDAAVREFTELLASVTEHRFDRDAIEALAADVGSK